MIAIPRLLTISQWIGGGRVKCCLRWLLPTAEGNCCCCCCMRKRRIHPQLQPPPRSCIKIVSIKQNKTKRKRKEFVAVEDKLAATKSMQSNLFIALELFGNIKQLRIYQIDKNSIQYANFAWICQYYIFYIIIYLLYYIFFL